MIKLHFRVTVVYSGQRKEDCLALYSHSGDFQHTMETTSCFSYFNGDVIDCCSTLPLCVFYNWLCLVHNPANNASPLCSSSRYGKIVSTKAILDKATNKCKGV